MLGLDSEPAVRAGRDRAGRDLMPLHRRAGASDPGRPESGEGAGDIVRPIRGSGFPGFAIRWRHRLLARVAGVRPDAGPAPPPAAHAPRTDPMARGASPGAGRLPRRPIPGYDSW